MQRLKWLFVLPSYPYSSDPDGPSTSRWWCSWRSGRYWTRLSARILNLKQHSYPLCYLAMPWRFNRQPPTPSLHTTQYVLLFFVWNSIYECPKNDSTRSVKYQILREIGSFKVFLEDVLSKVGRSPHSVDVHMLQDWLQDLSNMRNALCRL